MFFWHLETRMRQNSSNFKSFKNYFMILASNYKKKSLKKERFENMKINLIKS